ncbi:MAG: ribonuclease III [Deltaproteobacteria bacterium]|nr:ribonuclease III [Deltaproteobacteria bacterium]
MSADDLEARIGHAFADPALLRLALTHRSIVNETSEKEHNERLEFLGDAVLQLILTELLYAHDARADEGELSRLRATAVNKDALAAHARTLDLGSALRLGEGEKKTGGHTKSSLLADAFEAVVAAIHLDGGYDAAKAFVSRHVDIAKLRLQSSDPKTELQHYCQKMFHKVPTYRVQGESGPEHDRSFRCEVMLGDRVLGAGEGKSKKAAEAAAASAALALHPPTALKEEP